MCLYIVLIFLDFFKNYFPVYKNS